MKLILSTLLSLVLTNHFIAQKADTSIINKHLNRITQTELPRNYKNIPTLNTVADYIYKEFSKYADTTYFQEFLDDEKNSFKNVIAVLGPKNAPTIVLGAHYDVCGEQAGADDNASGVVGILELARLLKGKKLNYRIELVAYTLEEPPYFRSDFMGSYIHAKSLVDTKREVFGMVSVEMIGYFSNIKNSQEYPISFLSLIYGNKGNYITLVNKLQKGKFARKFTRTFKHKSEIRTKRFFGPENLVGVDFSDHLNYWRFNFSALMLTDTSFYRNKNYHEKTDTIETLNIPAMAKVIDSMVNTLLAM
jgi:Zn-dependent M28 family amino/carboxypeptidase